MQSHLADNTICKYFFHSIKCLFILLKVSFDAQNFLTLMKSNLPNFPSKDSVFGVTPKYFLASS